MNLARALLAACLLLGSALAQPAPQSATVPITLDHNRIIIDVHFPMPDGSKTRVRGWVDSGNPDLCITEKLARKLGLQLTGEARGEMGAKVQMSQPPRELFIGGMRIELKDVKEARALLDRGSIGGGLSAEINLPSTVLRNYDVLVDYPNREFTIAAPGVIKFHGKAAKATIGPANGLVQIPGTIEGETHNLGLDVGATISFISSEFTSKWLKAHPAWPHMKGAVGPANMWGLEEEPGWELLRVPRVEYGGAALTNVLAASFPKEIMKWFEQRAGVPTIGLIGTDALLNYTVGIDYAHSTVYFEKTSKLNFANMDVVGLVLRPEADERYTVIGIADYQGKPSVPDVQKGDVLLTVDGGRATGATMGQVWSLLSGSPGTVRTLTLERGGKQIVVKATVRRFLGDVGTAAPGRPSGAKLRN